MPALRFIAVTCTLAAVASAAAQDARIAPEVYAGRRARLVSQIGDAAVIVPGRYLVGVHDLPRQDLTFWYLTGVESPYAIVVMTRGRTALFVPDSFQFAGAQFPMVDSGFRRATWNRPHRVFDAGIAETYPIDQFADRVAGLVGNATTVYLPMPGDSLYAPPGLARPLSMEQQFARAIGERLPGRRFVDVTPLVNRMRLTKDRYEIDALRRAASISARSLRLLMTAVQPGMNDLEAAGFLEYQWKRLGAQRAAFAPIIGSGPNAMTFFTLMGEGYDAVGRTMRAGDLLFVDYGAAEYKRYASDVCRTIPVSGRFTAEQRKYYDIVLEAQEAAIARVKPGVMMLDVIKAAAEVFRKHGLERFEDIHVMGADRVWGIMPSPTHYLTRNGGITQYTRYGGGVRDIGHHVGLDATDSRDWSRPLEAGMVITIEPKIYIPDKQIAIMIEDMILVTTSGHENLSMEAPKRAAEIEAVMRRR